MRILYFDVLCGAAGDMLLASLIDLGFPVELLREQLKKLPIEPVELDVKSVSRNGIGCTQVTPKFGHAHEHRHLNDLLALFKGGEVVSGIYEINKKVLNRLADAEAKVHGIPKDQVHFHEVGAVDTIVDVLGVCMAIDYFEVDDVCFSTLTDGHGTIKASHGIMPVPVPATAAMLKGFKHRTLQLSTELLTPTGAALLTGLGRQVPDTWEGTVIAMGNGCGSKVFDDYPNYLRAVLLEQEMASGMRFSDRVLLLESDMDHISGEIMGDVGALLLDAGALDVSWLPLFMKKGRPGYRLSVITREKDGTSMVEMLMRHTRTLGVRVQQVQRVTAYRKATTGILEGEPCAAKECTFGENTFTKPEYEALASIARKKGIPVLQLMEMFVREQGKQ